MRDTGDISDCALWLEASSGTERSFAILFDRYRKRIFRKAYAHVRHVADAEDVVALVFLEAWRSRAKVRIVDGSVLPWLLTVTTFVLMNQARTARRHSRLLAALPKPEREPDHADDVLDRLERDTQLSAIRAALSYLSLQEKLILDLCLSEELPIAAVAAALDLPVGTVKSKLYRARQKVRKRLASRSAALDFTAQLDGVQP